MYWGAMALGVVMGTAVGVILMGIIIAGKRADHSERFMKRVYIAHPLRGDVEGNTKRATEICKQLSNSREVIPFSPLHAFGYLDPTGDQTNAMQHCFALLAAADELWVHGKWWTSEGCLDEILYAERLGIPIRYMGEESQRGVASKKSA